MITVFRIDAPGTGIELKGDGNPTPEQIEEEKEARQAFLDAVSPHFKALPERPLHAFGNVSKVELFGEDVVTRMNHYLLVVTVDIGDPRIEFESFVPGGTTVSTVEGDLSPISQWPDGDRR
ncbi:hypothetical protein J5Y04_25850 [Kitasatospora sp. RG8]|uniref:hypothetical protein n=1 Tax=Kitasatospora sp. RG8 TaxID=2820815 RepID=UPI001ADF6A6C|nr:hypothetical protein [Kitasatospora sp. RG8]MBP0452943.1 hypothetical protein [Kitasatospora sp. RG8]